MFGETLAQLVLGAPLNRPLGDAPDQAEILIEKSGHEVKMSIAVSAQMIDILDEISAKVALGTIAADMP